MKRCDWCNGRWVFAWLAAVSMWVCATAQAQTILGPSVGLNTLTNQGATLLVEDKLFGDFSFISGDFTASDVLVTPIQDSFGVGLRLSGGFVAVGSQIRDFIVQFSVTVTNSPMLISDVHMVYNGNYVGLGFSEVVETVRDTNGVVLGQFFVSNPPTILESTFYLPAWQTKIFVTKDVILYGGGGHPQLNRATISFIDQTFSQIPEPSTSLLVGAGLVFLLVAGRRRLRHP